MTSRTRSSSAAVAAALCAAAACAQQATSPAGREYLDGNAAAIQWYGDLRHQQIDNTQVGMPRTIRALAFRREGSGGGADAGPRTFDLRVRLDEVDMGLVHTEFDSNFHIPTQVVARRRTAFPDWRAAVGVPAPFDFVVPLDAPWSYGGQRALLIDFDVTRNTASEATVCDAVRSQAISSEPAYYGTGCTRSNGLQPLFAFFVQNSGWQMPSYGMRLAFRLYDGVPHSPLLFLLGFGDPAASVPGLCAPLRSDALVTLVVAQTSASGFIDYTWLSFPYAPEVAGVRLFGQGVQFDPTSTWPIPLVLTNAAWNVMPQGPWEAHEILSHTAELFGSPDDAFAEVEFGSGLVIELRT